MGGNAGVAGEKDVGVGGARGEATGRTTLAYIGVAIEMRHSKSARKFSTDYRFCLCAINNIVS